MPYKSPYIHKCVNQILIPCQQVLILIILTYSEKPLGFFLRTAPNPTFCVPSQFVSWSAQHERGEISDEAFAEALCHEMALPLSYEQFSHGWQAVFVALRPEVIAIMHKLREQGHRVVVLSNTNRLHTTFWPEEYPEIRDAADHIYLSQDLGMRKPEARIYQHVLQAEGFSPSDTVFFDDNADNIEGANQLGITSILVKDKTTIPDYFAKVLC